MQLKINPANLLYIGSIPSRNETKMVTKFSHLKNAMREIDLSSMADREEAKMDLRTAGVTGIRLLLAVEGGERGLPA